MGSKRLLFYLSVIHREAKWSPRSWLRFLKRKIQMRVNLSVMPAACSSASRWGRHCHLFFLFCLESASLSLSDQSVSFLVVVEDRVTVLHMAVLRLATVIFVVRLRLLFITALVLHDALSQKHKAERKTCWILVGWCDFVTILSSTRPHFVPLFEDFDSFIEFSCNRSTHSCICV